MRIITANTLSSFVRKSAESLSDFSSVVRNLILDVRDSYRPEVHYMRGLVRNGVLSISLGQGSILKPYGQPDSTNCRQCMCALANRPTSRDSRPRLRIHFHDTDVLGCCLALSPHFRSCLCLRSLGGNARLDAARRRRPLHRVAQPNAHAGRFGACLHRLRRTQTSDEV